MLSKGLKPALKAEADLNSEDKMLKIQFSKNDPYEIAPLFAEDVNSISLIVSDLHSKMSLKAKFLEKNLLLPHQTVMRASELWQLLLLKNAPDQGVIPSHLMKLRLRNLLQSERFNFGSGAKALVETIYTSLQTFVPLFESPDLAQILTEYLESQPHAQLRWGKWFYIAHQIWQEISQWNEISDDWISSYLIQFDLRVVDERKYVFLLGPSLTFVEAELIRKISQFVEVTVLVPEVFEREQLPAYGHLISDRWKVQKQPDLKQLRYFRHQTQLAEVQNAVALMRRWIDSGTPAQQILIICSDLESYWPALSCYLAEEGIPANKSTVARLGSLPSVASWLTTLHVVVGNAARDEYEMALFADDELQAIAFEKFRSLLGDFSEGDSLPTHAQLKSAVESLRVKATPMRPGSAVEFLAWSLQYFDGNSEVDQHLVRLLQNFLHTFQKSSETYSVTDYLQQLEIEVSKIEIRIEEGHSEGVQLESVFSLSFADAKHALFLGVSQAMASNQTRLLLTQSDSLFVAQNTGFILPYQDRNDAEMQLTWILSSLMNAETIALSYPSADFLGAPMQPLPIWLSGMMNQYPDSTKPHEVVTAPAATRLSELQLSFSLNSLSAHGSSFQLPKVRMSASLVETYLSCPFKVMASRYFGLQDHDNLELEPQPRSRGVFLHALLEELVVKQPVFSDQGSAQLHVESFLASYEKKHGPLVSHSVMRTILVKQMASLAIKFVRAEHHFRGIAQEKRSIEPEKSLKLWLNTELRSFDAQEKDIEFIVKIDRLERNEKGEVILLDYKSSLNGKRNQNLWKSHDELQLSFYISAVQSLGLGPVVGAYYYDLKEFSRSTGLTLQGASSDFTGPQVKQTLVTKAEFEDRIDWAATRATEVSSQLFAGAYLPNPRENSECQSCRWRQICRAKHLN